MTIKLENISKFYYSANAVTQALQKVKLEFRVGEFVAITGESGSGKSTLLNIISGMDTYDDGELYIDGEATSHFDGEDWEEYRKNKMGFVFQNYNLIENYTALYNVESSLLISSPLLWTTPGNSGTYLLTPSPERYAS
jgi:ABC-type lipoprotein export system ATPase subunit